MKTSRLYFVPFVMLLAISIIYVNSSVADNSHKKTDDNKIVLFDMFEYEVMRSGDKADKFLSHGWSGVKAINITGRHGGYVYTAKSIPGFEGDFPGKNSKHVLVIENASATIGMQSDFYLQFGNPGITGQRLSSDQHALPGNVWIQFWIYPNHYDDPSDKNDQLSYFDGGFKWIYPTSCGYPSKCYKWMFGLGGITSEPHWKWLGKPSKELSFRLARHGVINYTPAQEWNRWKLGQQELTETIVVNRWTLVKIHIDTTKPKGNTFELWLKPINGKWVKTAEWIDGVTPGLIWELPDSEIGGQGGFRMPTTVNPNYDWWVYLDDFVVAETEEALPVYPY